MNDRVTELLAAQPEGMTLMADFYLDEDVYRAELERIIYPNWWVVGHVSEWREPGDFRLFDVAGESVILVRDDDGELRGFANVCRHRGSRVCLESEGNTGHFACPYHGWQYGRDGKLVAARSMPDDFDRDDWSLKPVPSASYTAWYWSASPTRHRRWRRRPEIWPHPCAHSDLSN